MSPILYILTGSGDGNLAVHFIHITPRGNFPANTWTSLAAASFYNPTDVYGLVSIYPLRLSVSAREYADGDNPASVQAQAEGRVAGSRLYIVRLMAATATCSVITEFSSLYPWGARPGRGTDVALPGRCGEDIVHMFTAAGLCDPRKDHISSAAILLTKDGDMRAVDGMAFTETGHGIFIR